MFKFTARISKDILKQIFLDYKIEKLEQLPIHKIANT